MVINKKKQNEFLKFLGKKKKQERQLEKESKKLNNQQKKQNEQKKKQSGGGQKRGSANRGTRQTGGGTAKSNGGGNAFGGLGGVQSGRSKSRTGKSGNSEVDCFIWSDGRSSAQRRALNRVTAGSSLPIHDKLISDSVDSLNRADTARYLDGLYQMYIDSKVPGVADIGDIGESETAGKLRSLGIIQDGFHEAQKADNAKEFYSLIAQNAAEPYLQEEALRRTSESYLRKTAAANAFNASLGNIANNILTKPVRTLQKGISDLGAALGSKGWGESYDRFYDENGYLRDSALLPGWQNLNLRQEQESRTRRDGEYRSLEKGSSKKLVDIAEKIPDLGADAAIFLATGGGAAAEEGAVLFKAAASEAWRKGSLKNVKNAKELLDVLKKTEVFQICRDLVKMSKNPTNILTSLRYGQDAVNQATFEGRPWDQASADGLAAYAINSLGWSNGASKSTLNMFAPKSSENAAKAVDFVRGYSAASYFYDKYADYMNEVRGDGAVTQKQGTAAREAQGEAAQKAAAWRGKDTRGIFFDVVDGYLQDVAAQSKKGAGEQNFDFDKDVAARLSKIWQIPPLEIRRALETKQIGVLIDSLERRRQRRGRY